MGTASTTPPPTTTNTYIAPNTSTHTPATIATNYGASGTPSGTTAGAEPAAVPIGTISAKVIGVENNGETVVRTPIGTIKLFTASAPPLNSVLQMELFIAPNNKSATAQPVTTSVAPPTVSTFSGLSHDWRSLEEAMKLLAQSNNPAMSEALMQRIPNTKSKMVNSALFFMSALKSGDIRHWLSSRVADDIQSKSSSLFSRLSADFDGIRNVSAERPDQNWQMLLFPLMHEEKLRQVRLFIREDEHEESSESSGGMRFVIEVSMSALGDLQLDGFLKKQNKQLCFDLVVRSDGPLTQTMQDEIQAIFNDASEQSKFKGSLRFDPNVERFVHPLQDLQNRYDPDDDQSILA